MVKYGGHAMGEEQLARDFARDIVLLEQTAINPIVVHGGGATFIRQIHLVHAITGLGHVQRFQTGIQGFQHLAPSVAVAYTVAEGLGVARADHSDATRRRLRGEFPIASKTA